MSYSRQVWAFRCSLSPGCCLQELMRFSGVTGGGGWWSGSAHTLSTWIFYSYAKEHDLLTNVTWELAERFTHLSRIFQAHIYCHWFTCQVIVRGIDWIYEYIPSFVLRWRSRESYEELSCLLRSMNWVMEENLQAISLCISIPLMSCQLHGR